MLDYRDYIYAVYQERSFSKAAQLANMPERRLYAGN